MQVLEQLRQQLQPEQICWTTPPIANTVKTPKPIRPRRGKMIAKTMMRIVLRRFFFFFSSSTTSPWAVISVSLVSFSSGMGAVCSCSSVEMSGDGSVFFRVGGHR